MDFWEELKLDFYHQFGKRILNNQIIQIYKIYTRLEKMILKKEYEDILDKLHDLNQKAVKYHNESIKHKTCYLLEVAEERLK